MHAQSYHWRRTEIMTLRAYRGCRHLGFRILPTSTHPIASRTADAELLERLDAFPKEAFDGEVFRATRQNLDHWRVRSAEDVGCPQGR
jgi:hypothetical protein